MRRVTHSERLAQLKGEKLDFRLGEGDMLVDVGKEVSGRRTRD